MLLGHSAIGCWDNSTRGLDSASALNFIRTLRKTSDIIGTTHVVAVYQASQAMFNLFDNVIVLYEGRQIYFGRADSAKAYFQEMGWHCPQRQVTGDFLTSITNPQERTPCKGAEARVPRTPDDFEKYWKLSKEYDNLQKRMIDYKDTNYYAIQAEFETRYRDSQSLYLRRKSPYIIGIPRQLSICTTRAYKILWSDKASTITVVLGQIIMALIVGSVYFGTPHNTDSFFATGSTLFFATLLNALIAVTEINGLYAQRPIVEKHASYAYDFYN